MTSMANSPALATANLAPAPATPAIHPADRSDIHKSCRTIEVLVATLTDYCEAARAFATVQKKLVKALKDAAGIKAGVEYAANALSSSASIFEVLADVDAKFAKIADKECGSVNAEVKKWFKKLAKEEKAHDDRMNESNAKIKQAGQSYEKKSKKGTRDAGEEHARYINLLSVIGPEMSQEKHNHSMYVAQQHASTMFGVAACLARIADAEWARTCESMRRFAPTIGPLGEWKALCEGAWSGPLPDDLPDPSSYRSHAQVPTPHNLSPTPTMSTTTAGSTVYGNVVSEWGLTATSERSLPVPPGGGGFNPGSPLPIGNIPLEPPRPPYASNTYNSTNTQSSADSANSQGSVNSITTLSAFPLPPTHIPGPISATPISQATEAQRQKQYQAQQVEQMQMQNIHAALSHMEIQNHVLSQVHSGSLDSPIPTGSPLGADTASGMLDARRSPRIPPLISQTPSVSRQNSGGSPEERPSRPGSSMEHKTPFGSNPPVPLTGGGELSRPRRRSIVGRPPLPSPAPKSPLPPIPVLPSPTLAFRPDSPFKRSAEQGEREFGVQRDGERAVNAVSIDGTSRGRSAFKSQSMDAGRQPLVRSESTGSNVAALKNRYSRIVEAPSQGLKDIPRLPMSVSEMASRYQPVDEPMSPRRMAAASPTTDRFPPLQIPSDTPLMHQTARDMHIDENEIRKRKQRIEELAELELKEKEYELRQRERELNQRSRELERDKFQFLHSRPDFNLTTSANVGDGPKGPRNNRFVHKRGSQSVSHIVMPHPSSSSSSFITNKIASASTSHLPLPMPVPTPMPLPSPANTTSSPSRSQPSTPLPAKDHAPFCGCDTCSVAKYRLSNTCPSPHDLRPPEPPIMLRPEKPKGWMRRLSMPSVSGAFSLDAAKKNAASLASLKHGLPIPVGENGRLRKRSFEQGIVGSGVVDATSRR